MKIAVFLVSFSFACFSLQINSVSQWGIKYYFDKNYEVGTWANGDYWVKGPVTIDSITPKEFRDSNGGWVHGWQINPMPLDSQSLDSRLARFRLMRNDFPITIEGGNSVLKVISRSPFNDESLRPYIKVAAVLTVVDSIPSNNGITYFRPPYVGSKKTLYDTSSIRYNLLPSLEGVSSSVSIDAMYNQLCHVQMDHTKYDNQYIRPEDAMPYYGADVNIRNSEAILRLFLKDSRIIKMPLLIAIIQCGIDYYNFFINGNDWQRAGSGEQPGNYLPMVFAAYMLNDNQMIDTIRKSPISYEERTCYFSKNGTALWGSQIEINYTHDEQIYWAKLENHSAGGTSTLKDPYELIDGGYEPGGGYQGCCTSQPFKSTALILHIMPRLKTIWNPKAMLNYADRWVSMGIWTQPDSCAPIKGTYGVDYGPLPNKPGQCIPDKDASDGIGRYPNLHGTQPDGGLRKSKFVDDMWDKYRESLSGDIPRESQEIQFRQ